MTTWTVGSLFSGIGGLDLGLERAGWAVRWQIESDPFCQRVLAKHWPEVRRYGDIHAVAIDTLEPVALICGGFPCQPVSVAGKRRAQADERWLWPEFARILRALRPRLVLVENVPGLLIRGLGDVLGDLAALGYDAEWDGIPAAAAGAPHLRWRIFIVGHRRECGTSSALPDAQRDELREQRERQREQHGQPGAALARDDGASGSLADPSSGRREGLGLAELVGLAGAPGPEPDGRGAIREQRDAATLADADHPRRETSRSGQPSGQQTPRAVFGDSGQRLHRHSWWATEPDVGRVAHGVPARVDRLRGLGNAVVPQVAEWIGRRLREGLANVSDA